MGPPSGSADVQGSLSLMWVCHCRGVTDGEIIEAAKSAGDAEEVALRCGAGTACGGCRPEVRRLCAALGLPSVPMARAGDETRTLLRAS